MRPVLLITMLALAGCGAMAPREHSRTDASPEPFFDGNELVMPERMAGAVAQNSGRFRNLGPEDFNAGTNTTVLGDKRVYPGDALHRPWALLGDFDGDGYRDAALLQASPDSGRAIVVTGNAAPRTIELVRWNPTKEVDLSSSRGRFLVAAPAGPVSAPLFAGTPRETTFRIEHEGIALANWGTAAQTYFWRDDHFENVQTAD